MFPTLQSILLSHALEVDIDFVLRFRFQYHSFDLRTVVLKRLSLRRGSFLLPEYLKIVKKEDGILFSTKLIINEYFK